MISPDYHKDGARGWFLIRIGFYRYPKWVSEISEQRGGALFREIVFVDPAGVVEGMGRSWTPICWGSFCVLIRCFNPLNPKPLGLVIKEMFPEDYGVEIVEEAKPEAGEESPYLIHFEPCNIVRRKITINGSKGFKAFVEEEFPQDQEGILR